MNKLVLSFIMKDESHVLERMLNSAKSITDCIVCLDTGSSDNSIEIVENFGKENNIPTYILSEPFKSFDKSRNRSREMAYEYITQLVWDLSKTWIYFFDCDEELIIEGFRKESLSLDFYMIYTFINNVKYTRNTFTKMSKKFKFVGPVHEYITNVDQVTSGILSGISVKVHMEGASWQSGVAEKYRKHAAILEDFLITDDETSRDSRWIYYTAQSYFDSANTTIWEENMERLRRAKKYYAERVSRTDGYIEERYYSQLKIGEIMMRMESPWEMTLVELLKAYSIDCNRGESIRLIIEYYMSIAEWHQAYIYSKFAKVTFHGKMPLNKVLFIDEKIYRWRFLEMHAITAFSTGRKEEGTTCYSELLNILKNSPQYFDSIDVERIMTNKQFFNLK